MTQRTIYILMFALGGVMMTLPLFGTSITPLKIAPTAVETAEDTSIIICTFLTFDLSITDEGILARWVDISQGGSDIDYYELEHSTTGYDFSVIARLDSDEFSHLHQFPFNGGNYYRLKILGVSGDAVYTNIALANWVLIPGSISPSFVDTSASLYIESPVEEPGELKIYDMAGRLIYSESITLNENTTLVGLDFTGWNRGHYVVTVSGEQLGREVIRFVKQ